MSNTCISVAKPPILSVTIPSSTNEGRHYMGATRATRAPVVVAATRGHTGRIIMMNRGSPQAARQRNQLEPPCTDPPHGGVAGVGGPPPPLCRSTGLFTVLDLFR